MYQQCEERAGVNIVTCHIMNNDDQSATSEYLPVLGGNNGHPFTRYMLPPELSTGRVLMNGGGHWQWLMGCEGF